MFFFLDFLFQRFGQVAIKYFTDFMPVIYLPYIFNSKNSRVCVLLSVYNTMKYFTEIVAPRTFSKIILSHSFPLFFFFFFLCRYIFWKLPIIGARVWPSRSKKLYLILKFWNFKWFLTNTLSNNFLWLNSFHVSTQTTIIQNCVPESGHATVKYFIKI